MKADDLSVVNESNATGAIVWWRLSGETDVARLRARTAAYPSDAFVMPESPSNTELLHRTLLALSTSSKTRVINLKRGAFDVVQVEAEADAEIVKRKAKFTSLFRVAVDSEGTLTFAGSGNRAALEQRVKAEYDRQTTVYSPVDVSQWLIGMLRDSKAIALRDTGGIYYLPQPAVARYKALTQMLGQCSDHKLFLVPAMKTADAVRALLESLLAEVNAHTTRIEEALEKGDLGKRALQTKEAECAQLLEKVGVYEQILGMALPDILDVINRVQIRATQARLAA